MGPLKQVVLRNVRFTMEQLFPIYEEIRQIENRFYRALLLSTIGHQETLDAQGEPYILHPIRVANEFKDEFSRVVALLHDLVEDTAVDLLAIQELFGQTTADAVDALTRREADGTKEVYMDFIRRCSHNVVARRVKLMDIKDNSSLDRRIQGTDWPNTRYIRATRFLVDILVQDAFPEDIAFLSEKKLI